MALYSLSPKEIEIFRLGKTNPSIISNYFFKAEGADHGFIFDNNFTPEGKWQEMAHLATQTRIVVSGGYGSGKTQGIAVSSCVWAMTTLDFKFMNVAPVSWQSELMYRFIIDLSEDTPFKKLIYKATERPYPKIILKFYVGRTLVYSTLEFMSVDKNASKILSWDGDWINIDEAGKIDDLEETIKNTGSRLRGKTKHGRPRLGRLSMCSNPWENPQFWYRFDMASALPEECLSITVSTKANKNITDSQLKDILRDIPEDQWQQFIEGNRPVGSGNYFSTNSIYSCESKTLSYEIREQIKEKNPEYVLVETRIAGPVLLMTPYFPDHNYILVADPGTGEAPNRNAPAIMVWDLHDFPMKKAQLAAFWWGDGRGSITPFLMQYFRFMMKYKPFFNGVDSTGTQKGTAELLNTYLAERDKHTTPAGDGGWLSQINLEGIQNPNIAGFDFSGGRKPSYLINARLLIEAQMVIWPDMFIGLRAQLANYDPSKDHLGEPKIAQDLVACFAMSAHAIRSLFHLSTEDMFNREGNKADAINEYIGARNARLPDDARSMRFVGAIEQKEYNTSTSDFPLI